MRGLKSTIALALVLAGLGSYIYFVLQKEAESGASAGPNLEKVFAGLTEDAIQEISLVSGSGDQTTVKRDGTAWQITQPVTARAGQPEAQGVTSTLASMEVMRVIDENPTDLKQYGLEAPRLQASFKSSDAKIPSGTIVFGEKTPTGAGLYARKEGDKRVLMVLEFHETPLNKSTFDMREKAIVSLTHDKIDGIEVAVPGRPALELKKENGDWRITKPIAARADSTAVESLIARIETAQMKTIATEQATPADLRKYGLDRPDVAVTVVMGDKRTTLAVGAKAGDELYAQEAGQPAVATVEGTIAADLKKGAVDYRPKMAFEMRSFNASHVEIARGKDTLVLDRVAGTGDNPVDSWKRASPNPGTADKEKVEAFLSALADVTILSFADSTAGTGLDKPIMVVDARFQDGAKQEKVTFGQNGSDIYMAHSADPGAGRVLAERYTDAAKKFDELLK